MCKVLWEAGVSQAIWQNSSWNKLFSPPLNNVEVKDTEDCIPSNTDHSKKPLAANFETPYIDSVEEVVPFNNRSSAAKPQNYYCPLRGYLGVKTITSRNTLFASQIFPHWHLGLAQVSSLSFLHHILYLCYISLPLAKLFCETKAIRGDTLTVFSYMKGCCRESLIT